MKIKKLCSLGLASVFALSLTVPPMESRAALLPPAGAEDAGQLPSESLSGPEFLPEQEPFLDDASGLEPGIDENETMNETGILDETEFPDNTGANDESGSLDETEIPDEIGTPDETEILDEIGIPGETEISDKTEILDETGRPDETENPDETEIPNESEILDETGRPDETEILDETKIPDESEFLDETEIPDETEILNETGIPDEMEIPENLFIEPQAVLEDAELIEVTVPETGQVIVNPYGMEVLIDGEASTEQVASSVMQLVNYSNVPVQVDASVTGRFEAGSEARFVPEPPDPDSAEKELFLYLEFQNTEGRHASVSWENAFRDADNQILVSDYGVEKQGVLTLGEDGSTSSEGVFRLFGASALAPEERWDDVDDIHISVAFTFTSLAEPAEQSAKPSMQFVEDAPEDSLWRNVPEDEEDLDPWTLQPQWSEVGPAFYPEPDTREEQTD